jgi:prophage regulatory protein
MFTGVFPMNDATLWRLPVVKNESGLSRSTLYARAKSHLFTPPIALGARAVAWPKREVEALNAARIAGKTDDEIRALVKKLIAERQTE